MREKYIEQKLVREVKKRGGLCEKWNSGSSGWPDRIVLLPDGKIGFVEVKVPGEKPRKLQVHRHEQLRALGYKVFVLDDMGQIGGIIDAIQTAGLSAVCNQLYIGTSDSSRNTWDGTWQDQYYVDSHRAAYV